MPLSLLPRPLFSVALSVGVALVGLLVPRSAVAQVTGTTGGATIGVVQETSLPRLAADGSNVTKRPLTQEPEGVSLQDCLDNQSIAFPLQLAGYAPQSTLEAWAGLSGADCSVQTNRTGTARICWQIASGISLEPTPRPAIPVRQILSGASPDGVTTVDSSANICGRVNLTTISVQFLYFAPGQTATPETKKELAIRTDTIGPAAPGSVSVLPGNTRIRISFGGLGEGGLSQYTGVRAYCDPAVSETTTVTTEASVTQVCSEAGVDASDPDADASGAVGDCEEVVVEGGTTTIPGSECASPNFTSTAGDSGTGIVPNADFNAKFQCGSLTGNTGSALIADSVGGQPLENFKTYAVAIAAIDQFGNVGPLSSVFCEKPEPTTDFWENYKNAGGEAGGGFCSVEGAGLPVGSVAVTGIFGLALVGAWRRRRERLRSNDGGKRSGR
jgi:MYXO-CTERM domain-containing protein